MPVLSELAAENPAVALLQRSISRGRLAHAYLLSAGELGPLEEVATALAQALICIKSTASSGEGAAAESCGECIHCRRIAEGVHPDVAWLRPESKSRIITIDQIRELLQTVHLKPTEAPFKITVIVAADRLNVQGANAFLKTLEEPPPRTVFLLLTTDVSLVLETILSRCLRLTIATGWKALDPDRAAWLREFAEIAAKNEGGLLPRYKLLDQLLKKLNAGKERLREELTARSPLERHPDAEPDLREKWEDELEAAIESEYRRQRAELFENLQGWFRDAWILSLESSPDLLRFPELSESAATVGRRIAPADALENLHILERTQRLLHTNVQEALAIEVGFLNLRT
jgi:DNA polymerase-3 subunit delta'